MSSWKIITPAETGPITLAEAQAHLRVDSDDDAELVSGLITAATEYCEQAQGRAYVVRTYECAVPPAASIELPMPPFAEMVSVVARDRGGNDLAIEESGYSVDTAGTCAVLKVDGWYVADVTGFVITYKAGYGAAADVPQIIKQMMLLLIGWWYEHPETGNTGNIPPAVTLLLNLDRVNWGA